MRDIEQALRGIMNNPPIADDYLDQLMGDAITEIARLTAERDRLRAALKPFADILTRAEKDEPSSPGNRLECCRTDLTLYEFARARRAFEQTVREK